MWNKTLEIPLALLALGRGGQCNNTGDTWVHALGDAFNHPAFARAIAAFADDQHFGFRVFHPVLKFHKLGL